MLLQSRASYRTRFTWSGMPVPPEAMLTVIRSEEAIATFNAGEGGPLGTAPIMANGVYGPPIGVWRIGSMMANLIGNPSGIVRTPLLLPFILCCSYSLLVKAVLSACFVSSAVFPGVIRSSRVVPRRVQSWLTCS